MSRQGCRRIHAALLVAIAIIVSGGAAARAEVAKPTAQAVAAHAEFLAYAPPPPAPSAACVVDTGVRSNPDTDPVVLYREALTAGQTADDTGSDLHGSRGVMTAFAPINGWGASGIWPQGKAVVINALPAGQQGFPFDNYRLAIRRCAELAVVYPIRVVVLSLGASTPPDALQMSLLGDAVDQAHGVGLSVAAAAGNAGGAVEWPAASPSVFAVGAGDAGGALCTFSARGPELDLVSPGCPVETAFADTGAPASVQGTSSANDIAAAVLSALRGYRPDLRWDQAEQLLRDTSYGDFIDVRAAFEAAGLGSVVDAGERAAAAAKAAPSDAQLAPPPATSTTPRAHPAQPRWPTPKVRIARFNRHVRIIFSNRPKGATVAVTLQQFSRGGVAKTLAHRRVRRGGVTLDLPSAGGFRITVHYLASTNHRQSRAVQRTVGRLPRVRGAEAHRG